MEAFWLPSDTKRSERGRNPRILNGDENGIMGIITKPMTVINNRDLQKAAEGLLPPDQVRSVQLQGIVDTAANWLVLPEAAATQLGLPLTRPMIVRFGDGRMELRNCAEEARVELSGRQGTFRAILEPNRTDALIGAIVLEDLDLIIDCKSQTVEPRDPKQWTGNV